MKLWFGCPWQIVTVLRQCTFCPRQQIDDLEKNSLNMRGVAARNFLDESKKKSTGFKTSRSSTRVHEQINEKLNDQLESMNGQGHQLDTLDNRYQYNNNHTQQMVQDEYYAHSDMHTTPVIMDPYTNDLFNTQMNNTAMDDDESNQRNELDNF